MAIAGAIVTAWIILGHPFVQQPMTGPGMVDTAAGRATSDSSGWLDTSSYAPRNIDSLHPGDTLPR
ncbi:MAG: hypothetical protein ABI876_00715 [Bacteroidota bacterium]